MLNIQEIMAILPHRDPMLLVDRILEIEPLKRAVGIKNVTANEPFFAGHFPQEPVMPGVLICEAMAQVAGVALLCGIDEKGVLPMFTGINRTRFRSSVVPGDTLRTEAEVLKIKGTMGKVHCCGYVGDTLKAEGEFMFYLQYPETNAPTEEKTAEKD